MSKNISDPVNPRPRRELKPRAPSGYSNEVHGWPVEDSVDDQDSPTNLPSQKTRSDRRPGSRSPAVITDSGHGGRRRHDHEVRDDGGAEAREHDKAGDSPVDLRPGTTVERRKIADLVPSPWQSQYYDDLSDFDLKALASDIKQHRLRDPVEILPENGAGLPTNMVLDGCQRLAALRRNGETEVIVRVR